MWLASPSSTDSVISLSGWVKVPDFSQNFSTNLRIRCNATSLGLGLMRSPGRTILPMPQYSRESSRPSAGVPSVAIRRKQKTGPAQGPARLVGDQDLGEKIVESSIVQ